MHQKNALCVFLEPLYYKKYDLSGKNTQYSFSFGLAVLLTHYGNGCGQGGEGVSGAAAELGMYRSVASRYITKLEELQYEMKDEDIYFPSPDAGNEWSELTDGIAARKADFPDVACIYDCTLMRTRRPSDFQVLQYHV
ncbi:hypothetical protein GN958_ATG04940 [Phytophthora infestans]|uniref:Uncharacterized protein n=1 Tax=Phytophthora infestans TaxID=4787 RepID=A0A8S9V1B1_PHYIN|nr:hypothetical protein GN958_ATG04940 [Phytophthora infestans]